MKHLQYITDQDLTNIGVCGVCSVCSLCGVWFWVCACILIGYLWYLLWHVTSGAAVWWMWHNLVCCFFCKIRFLLSFSPILCLLRICLFGLLCSFFIFSLPLSNSLTLSLSGILLAPRRLLLSAIRNIFPSPPQGAFVLLWAMDLMRVRVRRCICARA